MKNFLNNKIFFIVLFAIALTSFGILQSVNATHENVEATHGEIGITKDLTTGTNKISFRDAFSGAPQTNTTSIDASIIKAGFFIVTVNEEDKNLDSTAIEVILSSATSTTSGNAETQFSLTETGPDSGIFQGNVPVTIGSESGKLPISAGDAITVIPNPEPEAVGRLFAELRGVTNDDGSVEIKDDIIRDDGTATEPDLARPFEIIIHPVEIQFTGTDADEITVTMSYANAIPNPFNADSLELVYRPVVKGQHPGTGFFSLTCPFLQTNCKDTSKHDFDAKTITNIIQPSTIHPLAPAGQFSIGVNTGFIGGGGGGLVRQGLVVNVILGSGSLAALFGGGSGGGANPTFGDASLLVLENVTGGFGGVISEGDDLSLDSTKVVEIGDTVVLRFDLFENQGINNLEQFRMFLNFEGENYDTSTIDTHITYKRDGEITIVDPHEKIEKAEIEILLVDPWNLIVNVKIIFKNTFNTSILVDSWDLDRNSGKKLIPDALQVVEPSILLADAQKVLNEPTPDLTLEVLTETELTEIPVWIKSNALWWKQKQIDDSDFMAGIKYLIEKTMIEVDQNELSNSLTTKEIPVWISDVAGMWADDSITDEEFINIMQWLISNGILQVRQ